MRFFPFFLFFFLQSEEYFILKFTYRAEKLSISSKVFCCFLKFGIEDEVLRES